jgi:hypothetical protein
MLKMAVRNRSAWPRSKGLNIRSFRRILGASHDIQVYNTMFTPAATPLYGSVFELTGTPVSYIVPQALLFEELDLVRETQQFVRKAPVVENPVKILKVKGTKN